MNKNKKLAFTLAEVLIVIGIIGVVAALTLPNLNHATGDKEKVTKVKKIYSTLTEALDRAQVTYGNVDTWFKDLSTDAEKNERFAKRITEFMKVSKDCGFNEGCFSTSPVLFLDDGSVLFDNYLEALQDCSSYMVSLPDNTSLAFQGACSVGGGANYKIRVDIDGQNKGKNMQGLDLYEFFVNDDYDYPNYLSLIPGGPFYNVLDRDTDILTLSTGQNATFWVIENGNLDYLKCPEELNWETKTSCE